jgi:hypothetical protein
LGPARHGLRVDLEVDVGREGEDSVVEEFFGQLWAIPSYHSRRSDRGPSQLLCWIRKGIPDRELQISDCFPAGRSALLHHHPRLIRVRDRVSSSAPSFVEVLRREMASSRGRGRGMGGQPRVADQVPQRPPPAAAPPRRVNNQGRQYPNQNQQGRQFQRFPQNNQRYVPTNLGN